MKTPPKKALTAIFIAFIFGFLFWPAYAGTLDRTNWFNYGGTMTSTPGHLVTTAAASDNFCTTYFAPSNNPVTLGHAGDQLQITWIFTPSSIQNLATGAGFETAVVNTPVTNYLTSDNAPEIAPYTGYANSMSTRLWSENLLFDTVWEFTRTNPDTADPLFSPSTSPWIADVNGGFLFHGSGPTNVPYTFTTIFTRNAANGLNIQTLLTNNVGYSDLLSYTDNVPNTFTFNTFCIYINGVGSTRCTLDTTGFEAVFSSEVPLLGMLGMTNGQAQFMWNALTGHVYQVQYASDLSLSNWFNLGSTITATNPAIDISDPVSTNQNRYYRVLFLQ